MRTSRSTTRDAARAGFARLAGALLAAAGCGSLAAPAAADDWAQFQGERRDNRARAEVEIARAWAAGGPPVLWTVAVEPGFGGASILGDEVFVAERVDGAKDSLRCLSLATGKEVWRFVHDVPGHVNYDGARGMPAVDGERVYFTGPFGHVYCVDRKTQRAAWTKNVFDAYDAEPPRWGYACSPLLYEDLVIVPAMGPKVGLVAFKRATGAVAWESPALGGDSYTSPSLHRVGGVDQVLFSGRSGDQQGAVAGVDAKTGKLLWRYDRIRRAFPIPTATEVAEGRFFITSGYGAGSAMLQVTKGASGWSVAEVFRIENEGAQIHPAVVHDGHLYANFNNNRNLGGRRSAGSPEGIWCIGLDGTRKWRGGATTPIDRGTLLLVGDLLLVLGGEDGVLRLVDPSPEGYKELSAAKLFDGLKPRENHIWAPMSFARGKLLVRSQTELKCLDLGKQSSGSF